MQAPLRPPPVLTMAVALAASWASMLAHNMYELPLAPIDVENSGPLLLRRPPSGGLLALWAGEGRAGRNPWLGVA